MTIPTLWRSLGSCTTALQGESRDLQEESKVWWTTPMFVESEGRRFSITHDDERAACFTHALKYPEPVRTWTVTHQLWHTRARYECTTLNVSISGRLSWKWLAHYCSCFLFPVWQLLLSQGLICPVSIIMLCGGPIHSPLHCFCCRKCVIKGYKGQWQHDTCTGTVAWEWNYRWKESCYMYLQAR